MLGRFSEIEVGIRDPASTQTSQRRLFETPLRASSAKFSGPGGGDGRECLRGRRVRLRGPASLARYGGDTASLALAVLFHLESCGDLLKTQMKTLPRYDASPGLKK